MAMRELSLLHYLLPMLAMGVLLYLFINCPRVNVDLLFRECTCSIKNNGRHKEVDSGNALFGCTGKKTMCVWATWDWVALSHKGSFTSNSPGW